MRGKIAKGRYYLDGREVTKARFDAAFPDQPIRAGKPPGTASTGGWPILSDAVGVHPSQRAEAEADAKSKGVPTEVNSKGQIVLRSPAHRKAYLKAYGFYDRNSNDG